MFELIVFTEETRAETAAENSSAVIPNPTVTLDAHRVLQRTRASMGAETVFTVTNPGFTEVTDRSNHLQACRELPGVLDNTVSGFLHAFLLATLCAHRETLNRCAKVTESSVFLLSLALVALHIGVARMLSKIYVAIADFLLTNSLLLCLLPLTGLLLGHSAENRTSPDRIKSSTRGRGCTFSSVPRLLTLKARVD